MTTNKKETEQSEVACYDTKTFQGQLCKRLQAVAEAHAGIGDGQELVKKLTQEVYNAMLEAEMEEHLGYGWHDREGRGSGNSRNGKLTKKVIADIGDLEIETPRDRNGTFEPKIIEKRQTKLKHFSGNIISLYTRGLTTREIEDHLREIYGIEVSESFISRVTDEVKERINEWQTRALDPLYSIVYFDGIRFNVREDGRVKNKVVYVCYGVAIDGHPDVLGLWISENEGAGFWLSICNELKSRGVKDILIACVDGLSGLPEAIESVFSRVDVQLCVVHQIRAVCKYINWKDRKVFCQDMKAIYGAPTLEVAELALEQLDEKWGKKYPAAIKSWRQNWVRLTAFFKYPVELRVLIYTTNAIENLNSILRKNTRNRKVFPSDEALMKILYLNVYNITKKWTVKQNWGIIFHQLSLLYDQRISCFV